MELNPHEERILQLLSQAHNRAIVSILSEAGRPLHVEELTDRLVTRNIFVVQTSEFEEELDSVLISLHHNHLPKLEEADLIEYDQTRKVATYQAVQSAGTDRVNAEHVNELLARFQGRNGLDAVDIGVVDGRENVIQRGRELTDEATEELFFMVLSTDLIGENCLSRVRNAIKRGVDIYLGSQNPSVREYARQHIPEITVWEPQLDWLNTPTSYPKVGRLVLADREKVMLGVLNESALDGTDTETAATGEGATNPLVVLVRELLGPRLDHLDFQSGDFSSELPYEP